MKLNIVLATLFLLTSIQIFANENASSTEVRVGKVVAVERTIQIEIAKCKANFKMEPSTTSLAKHGYCAVPVKESDVLPQYTGTGITYVLEDEGVPVAYFFAGPKGYSFTFYGKKAEVTWEASEQAFSDLLKQNHLGNSYTVAFTKVVPE